MRAASSSSGGMLRKRPWDQILTGSRNACRPGQPEMRVVQPEDAQAMKIASRHTAGNMSDTGSRAKDLAAARKAVPRQAVGAGDTDGRHTSTVNTVTTAREKHGREPGLGPQRGVVLEARSNGDVLDLGGHDVGV